jgi:hypothetical protein
MLTLPQSGGLVAVAVQAGLDVVRRTADEVLKNPHAGDGAVDGLDCNPLLKASWNASVAIVPVENLTVPFGWTIANARLVERQHFAGVDGPESLPLIQELHHPGMIGLAT